MTILEQILDGLKTKFPGVEVSILTKIAEKIGKNVTTAEQVTTAVEGVTFQSVLQSYGDSRATEAQQTAVRNYESKHGLKNGEKILQGGAQGGSTETNPETKPKGGAETDKTTELIERLLESNKRLTERLDKMDGERTTATRQQQLSAITDKLPENLRKGYSRISLNSLSEEEFSTLLNEVSTEVDGIVNDTQAKGAVFSRPTVKGVSPAKGSGAKTATDEEVNAVVDKLGI